MQRSALLLQTVSQRQVVLSLLGVSQAADAHGQAGSPPCPVCCCLSVFALVFSWSQTELVLACKMEKCSSRSGISQNMCVSGRSVVLILSHSCSQQSSQVYSVTFSTLPQDVRFFRSEACLVQEGTGRGMAVRFKGHKVRQKARGHRSRIQDDESDC